MEPAPQAAADLESIFRDHHAMVFRAAYRVTGSASDAEDVLQTVFLRMLKRDPEAEPVVSISSFLHRAAVNAAVDLVRSRQNIRNIPLDEFEPVLAESSHRGPDRALASGEIRDWLRAALAPSEPAHRRNVHPSLLRRKGKSRNCRIAQHHARNGCRDAFAHPRPTGKGIPSLSGRSGMNQELDQAVSDIRNQTVDDAVVEAAAARVWARISAAAEAPAMGAHC